MKKTKLKRLLEKINNSSLLISISTSIRKLRKVSDFQRWGNEKGLHSDWDSRTKQISALIQPGESVIEFGAGRMILKKFLPEKCTYTPSDIIERENRTIICDLNCNLLPQFPSHDVAVFSGVL